MCDAGRSAIERSTPAFDASVIEALRSVLGADQLVTLIEGAAQEIERRLNAVADLAKAGETGESMRWLAHDLVGLAGQIGLAALAEAARNLEDRARDDGPVSVAEAVEALLALREDSLTAFRTARAEVGRS